MSKGGARLSRLGVLAPAALSVCVDASVLAAPAAGAILSTVLKELSKAFMLKKWFHGVMTAQEAEHLLMQKGKNGSYLVRESQTHPGEYVLSVRVRARVKHVMIRREHNKYNVGSGEVFDDLSGLIEHCRAYPLTATSGDVLRLMQPVNSYWTRSRPVRPRNNAPAVPLIPDMVPSDKSPETNAGSSAGSSTSSSIMVQEITDCDSSELMDMDNMDVNKEHAIAPLPEEEDSPSEVDEALPKAENDLIGSEFYGTYLVDKVQAEFYSLKQLDFSGPFTSYEGARRQNSDKNRFRNVLPYDQTRVILPKNSFTLEEDFSDYINASYIKSAKLFDQVHEGYTSLISSTESSGSSAEISNETKNTTPLVPQTNSRLRVQYPDVGKHSTGNTSSKSNNALVRVVKDKYYIAAQGCLRSTMQSFWQMIVHNDVRVIAMVTNTVENERRMCERYWPLVGEAECHGDAIIRNLREICHGVYTIREFEVTTAKKKCRTVYHYQFKAWPDHEAPSNTKGLLSYLEDINDRMIAIANGQFAPKENILCVHCSAGIGRTGTFIALDMLVDQIKAEGADTPIDIQGVVKLIRAQRPGMVQNSRQYSFLYNAIREYKITQQIQKKSALKFEVATEHTL